MLQVRQLEAPWHLTAAALQDSPKVRPRCRRIAFDWYRVRSPSWNLGSWPNSWEKTVL